MVFGAAWWSSTSAREPAINKAGGRTIRVGPQQPVKTIAGASEVARDGDTVEIESGQYSRDTAVWTQNRLTIRGLGARPQLIAAGEAAEGKGIWVIRGGDILVENIAFSDAKVPDMNGAGIRLEQGRLTVRRCAFIGNENGMLVNDDPSIVLEIDGCEFADNGAGDGQSHNLYVGSIRRLVVQGSYFHRAKVGHLLKSRAKQSFVQYNRLTDEPEGSASYELEFPAGGIAFVIGNLIEQGPQTENSTIISLGAEGYKWPSNELYLSHNTIVNDRPQGAVYVTAAAGPAYVKVINNIFVGKGELAIRAKAEIGRNWTLPWSEFVRPMRLDYRLKEKSSAIGVAGDPGSVHGVSLRPAREYVFPTGTSALESSHPATPGAFQTPGR